MHRRWILVLAVVAACWQPSSDHADARTIVAFNAGSLARPLRAALDSFALHENVEVNQESAGSLETARKLTELGNIPDVVALADEDVFPQLLMPSHVSWYARFAHNRVVLAYTDKSRGAGEVTADNWWQVLQRPGVETGRSDPQLDPNGYRTLLVIQLAERHYATPGLAAQLMKAMPARNVRPKEADLVGLLQAGEFDYIWSYESMARNLGLKFVRLPQAIDLSSPADSAVYNAASVRVRGKGTDSVTFRGRPIVYALSIPNAAPHRAVAERFVRFLLSADGRRVLRAQGLDALDTPSFVGSGVPDGIAPWMSTPAVSSMSSRAPQRVAAVLAALASSLLLLFLAVPIGKLVASGGAEGIQRLASDAELRQALWLTAVTATAATLLGVAGGTPLAYLLARREFRGRAVLSALLDLPLLVPHPVAGIALLLLLGRESAVGSALLSVGLRVVGTPLGIVAAMLFVAAPLFISGAREAFARVNPRYEAVARTLGDSPLRAFVRITLPLSRRGLIASSVVMWARAVSEFGAIVVLTYNPKVASVLSYDRFTSFGLREALPVAAVLALLALIPLTALRTLRGADDGAVP